MTLAAHRETSRFREDVGEPAVPRPANPTWKRVVNAAAVQVGWTACALGAAHGLAWIGPVIVILLVGAQLPLVAFPSRQAVFIGLVALGGWLLDSSLAAAGMFSFPPGQSWGRLAPVWMAALWANFATTLHLAFDWLRGRYLLAAVLGAIGGPLAYWGGHGLGAIDLAPSLPLALAAIAVEWAVAMPLLVRLARAAGR